MGNVMDFFLCIDAKWAYHTRKSNTLNVDDARIVGLMERMIRHHAGRIRLLMHHRKLNNAHDDNNLFTAGLLAVSQPEHHSDIAQCSLCLGDSVAFMDSYETEGICLTARIAHAPRVRLEARTLTVRPPQIKRLVEIFVDVVQKCRHFRAGRTPKKRRSDASDGETDDEDAADYDCNEPESWGWGLHSCQLSLLMLKRCVHENVLEVADPAARAHFLRARSHSCLPEELDRLIDATWPGTPRASYAPPSSRCWFY